jgi:hypothetical protein
MNTDGEPDDNAPFLTVEAVLAAHEHLLSAQDADGRLARVRGFVERLIASGAIFDEAGERKALQGTLDYWTSELTAQAPDQDAAGHRRPMIRDFDAGALTARQHEFENPFGVLAERVGALDADRRRSPTAIIELIQEVSRPQGLRFQDGLLREMANQVAGESHADPATQAVHDREDATLLEFCLWHLFEDTDTRLGNKLYRPRHIEGSVRRVDFFSCKVYLVRKTQQLYDAQSEREQAALLDQLMRVDGRGGGGARPASRLAALPRMLSGLPRAVEATRAPLRTFRLYRAEGLDLQAFLRDARLVFADAGKPRLVHPALARWDPLKERRWKAAASERRFFLTSTIVLVAGATVLAWLVWYWAWTDVAMDHLARSQIAAEAKPRLDHSVAGLRAANLSRGANRAYATQVANDAIGRIIGERARKGRGDLDALLPYPQVPRLECEQGKAPGADFVSYTVRLAADAAKLSALAACPTFAVDLDGTRLAAAWQRDGRVRLRVFDIPRDFSIGGARGAALTEADISETAAWIDSLQEQEIDPPLHRQPAPLTEECKDRALRFSEDGTTVSLECLYSTGERLRPSALKWVAARLRSAGGSTAEAGVEQVVHGGVELGPCNAERSAAPRGTANVTAVFLGPRSGTGSGFVAVRGDGSVEIWHDPSQPPCLSTQFFTDFVRVAIAGRPVALDVQDLGVEGPRALYALYAHSAAPVLRIYQQLQAEQATLLLEHYPPAGVGTPVAIRFTPQARCLQVRAIRNNDARQLVYVDYHLVLDSARLLTVGHALQRDLAGDASVTDSPLPEYHRAIQQECGRG